jgi:hypothetical protein
MFIYIYFPSVTTPPPQHSFNTATTSCISEYLLYNRLLYSGVILYKANIGSASTPSVGIWLPNVMIGIHDIRRYVWQRQVHVRGHRDKVRSTVARRKRRTIVVLYRYIRCMRSDTMIDIQVTLFIFNNLASAPINIFKNTYSQIIIIYKVVGLYSYVPSLSFSVLSPSNPSFSYGLLPLVSGPPPDP